MLYANKAAIIFKGYIYISLGHINDEGHILAMITGTLGHINERANELWALLLGLRLAHVIRENVVELETESADALQEWADWRWFIDPRHPRVIQQLIQRSRDPNLLLRRRRIMESQNRLARYLAEHGAATRTRAVRVYGTFGRVSELWHLDMGLGFIGGQFMVIDEDEYLAQQQQEEEWMVEDEDGGSSDEEEAVLLEID